MAALRPLPAEASAPRGASQGSGAVQPTSGGIRRARHLLVLPDGVDVEEVELLALSRFPSSRWEHAPELRRDVVEPGTMRTSRHTVIVGPYARGSGAPGCVLEVICPRERGEAPYEADPDPDGVLSAFASGVPVREEGRVVAWLVAAARRLGAMLVFDETHVVTPDPDASVDLTVFSDVWLDPAAALATVQRAEPRAAFAPGGQDWAGPPADVAARPLPGGVTAASDEREAIHAAADEVDLEVLRAAPALSGYALHIDLDVDGLVALEIGGEEALPTSLQGLPWANDGAIAYRVRWFPQEDGTTDDVVITHHGGTDVPTAFRVSRARASERIARLARVLHATVGGEIADRDDFLINPEDL